MEHTVIIVTNTAGDWTQVFVNGKLVVENHSIRKHELVTLLRHLGCEVKTVEHDDEAEGWEHT